MNRDAFYSGGGDNHGECGTFTLLRTLAPENHHRGRLPHLTLTLKVNRTVPKPSVVASIPISAASCLDQTATRGTSL